MNIDPAQRSNITQLLANLGNRARGNAPEGLAAAATQRAGAARFARAEAQEKPAAAQTTTPAKPTEAAARPERVTRQVLPEDRLLNNLRVYKMPVEEPKQDADADTEAAPALAGDVNNDGKVDVFDFNALASAYGTENEELDIFKDGIIDDADMAILRQNFGKSV